MECSRTHKNALAARVVWVTSHAAAPWNAAQCEKICGNTELVWRVFGSTSLQCFYAACHVIVWMWPSHPPSIYAQSDTGRRACYLKWPS